jgi:hypothetical protein
MEDQGLWRVKRPMVMMDVDMEAGIAECMRGTIQQLDEGGVLALGVVCSLPLGVGLRQHFELCFHWS